MNRRYEVGKRALDLAISVPALLVSLPIQAGVAAAVAIKLGRPVLFRQMRPGLHGEPFEMIKFRTMRVVDPSRGWIDDASRMTGFGRVLRSTSLDELPSLWNVVRGDMSLVGPRPLLLEYVERYTPHQARRHNVRPGLTGLAQVSGRNGLSWDDKFNLDVEYVDRRSMRLDLKILLATVRVVVRRDGIVPEGQEVVPYFNPIPTLTSSIEKAIDY
jgi:lipopolysaccharide/colanic/teichoic acid biosynthesis glycosyltransferase